MSVPFIILQSYPNLSELNSQKIDSSGISEFLEWVHFELPSAELAIIEAEVAQRTQSAAAPAPKHIVSNGRRLAGAYFTCLPGRLAMLGAIRTLPGLELMGKVLLRELVRELHEQFAATQIQAALNETDQAAHRMLVSAGFQPLTSVDQMWCDASLVISKTDPVVNRSPIFSGRQDCASQWYSANSMSEVSLAALVESTFQDSLDCPELNGLRKSSDVLASFLMGRKLCDVDSWEVLTHQGQAVGCLLLSDHSNLVSEIAYMGLVPGARQQGLGRLMVLYAVERARRLGHSGVVLAVDVRNYPAIRTYQSCGFRYHCRLKIYTGPTAIP